MKSNYRVVKITRLNGEICWAVQKQFRHWLTGKEIWKYYADYACESQYSKYLCNAECYLSEESANKQVSKIIMNDTRSVVDIQVVRSITAEANDTSASLNINEE